MPRSGGGRSRSRGRGGSSFPSSFGSRSAPPKPPAPAQTQHPSMMRQMAATAGGVAAGSLLAGAIMGSGRRNESEEGQGQQSSQYQPEQDDPCILELSNLIACFEMVEETGSDLKICEKFEKKLKECRQKYGQQK